MMNSLESKLNQYLLDRGIMISVISSKTGVPDSALYNSLRGSRKLRGDELLSVCRFLQVNPMEFLPQPLQPTGT